MRKPLKPEVIARARQLRNDRPDMERLLWWKLRAFNRFGYHFRRQVPLKGYFLDFAEHKSKVAIELDGEQRGHANNSLHDTVRDSVIFNEGFAVLRFWNREVRSNLDGVVETIVRAVDGRSPPEALRASTSPQRGGDLSN
jgi:very-short-patch-repair endonuclease